MGGLAQEVHIHVVNAESGNWTGGTGHPAGGVTDRHDWGVGWLAAGPKEAQPKQAEALPKQAEAKAEQAQAQAQAASCASSVEIRTSFQVFWF